ncbi:MAG TPA: hypothetical protein VGM12_10930 [Trebonia sp.]|jgi:hypothetical protein
MTGDEETGRRREFRAWVRARHPDAGGEPGEFAAGLALWRERLARGADEMAADGAADGAAADGEDRALADVTVFRTYNGLWAARRWWQRQRQPPRVR